ncbi:H-type small acid-soluble spore protein [Virgibacillus sediminis]|uniref:Small, acid-soluble spore protein H n=1 Tax=Virgibacillus sediminis TaxID=202260 RepID=A0ABV7A1S3_9BACI
MDKQRAKEIRQSENLINVTFRGNPIYIQNIDEQNETANVYMLENPQETHRVSLGELQEQ